MHKTKILYVTTELDPFLTISSLASVTKRLAQSMGTSGYEVRVIMPKFGVINERKNSLNKVQRLDGINVGIEDESISLTGKVAPIRKGKIQVYFIDNEELFQSRAIFRDRKGRFYKDNDIRIAFICKAVWIILQELRWAPDIIHCMGWAWAFVPTYGKVVYSKLVLFKNTKFVHTYSPEYFTESLGPQIIKKGMMQKTHEKHFKDLGDQARLEGFLAMAKTYADQVTYSFKETYTPALDAIRALSPLYIPDDHNMMTRYKALYDTLLEEQEPE